MPRPDLPRALGADADPNAIEAFLDHIFDHDQPLRRIMRSTMNRADSYYRGAQWLEPIEDGGAGGDQLRGTNWKPMSSDLEGIPMPVQNEIFPEVTREIGLLVGVGSQPYIRPEGDDPDSENGAKLAKDVLLSRLEDLGWLEQQQEGGQDCALLGTWNQASYWDVDLTKTTRVPVKGALKCPAAGCDFTMASRTIEDPEAGERMAMTSPGSVDVMVGTEPPNPLIEPERTYLAKRCATCKTHRGMGEVVTTDLATGLPAVMQAELDLDGPPELEGFTPTSEQAKSVKDFLGRPLGEDVALGDTMLEVIHPQEAFADPGSKGVGSKPDTWEEFAWEKPRSLDWLRARYKNGYLVKAQEGMDLWEHHPVIGSVEGLATATGPGVFENHALWRLFAKKPFMEKQELEDGQGEDDAVWKLNRGRLIISANRVVLFDGDLMVESLNNPGVLIQRFHFDWAPWELRRLQAHGIGMAEIAFSQQDAINTSKSQWMNAQHRNGSPKWLAEEGVGFTYVGGAGSGYDSDFLTFTKDDPDKGDPREFVGHLMDAKVLEVIERDVASLKRTMMRAEVDSGEPPKGVDAFSALQLLERKSNEGRKPRNARLQAMKRRIYKHQLELIHEFYREERQYKVRGGNDKWSVKSFTGMDLHRQTNVSFEDEPTVDRGIAKRTGIMQGIQIGSVKVSDAASIRRINRHLEIPLDINENENNQVDLAETELSKWFKEGIEPVIDEDGDDNQIHWGVHKEDLCREEMRERKYLCHWNEVLFATWGWKTQLKAIEFAEMNPPVAPLPSIQVRSPEEFAQAQAMYQQKVALAQAIAAMPKPIELRIMTIWQKMIDAAGVPEMLMGDPEALKALAEIARAEAHAAGHRWIAEKKMLAAAGGAAQPAAPGGTATSAGTIPGPGQAAAAPPGAGGESRAAAVGAA